MKNPMTMIPLVLSTLALAASAASAGDACCGNGPQTGAPAAKQAAANKVAIVCPVMKSKIASADKAAGKSVYKGKTYYFCCGGCKPMFDKNPAKYVKG